MKEFHHKINPASYADFVRDFSLDMPSDFNFAFDYVDAVAAATPDRLAMVHIDPQGRRREFDFKFFSQTSSRLANALKEQGIGKGDTVMVILFRRMEFWIAALALHKIGAVIIPSPNLLTSQDIEHRVPQANVRAVIADDEIVSRIEQVRPKCPGLQVFIKIGPAPLPDGWLDFDRLLEQGGPEFPKTADAPGGDDPLLIFFSSGTTGMPKMVEHNHFYPFGHLITGVYWHNLNPGDLHLTLADSGWGKFVWGKFYGQWFAGGVVFTWDFRGKFIPAELLKVLSENKVNSFCAPPTVYRFLLHEDLKNYDLTALHYCTTAGELLNESVYESWKKLTGLEIHEGYGQTETTLQLATFPCMAVKPGSVGLPIPLWNIELLDDDDQPCPRGEEGEICVRLEPGRNPGLFTAYRNEPERTAAVCYDGYYHTGDKAWQDEDGYYWFLGRKDDLIKSSGYRVGPFEVESALITHPAVIEAAVTGVPDPDRGQIIKATLVLAAGYEPSEALTAELQTHVKKITAPYKYPRVIEYVKELPKTISGKIKRSEIREADAKKFGAVLR